jgi:hypothetical protein
MLNELSKQAHSNAKLKGFDSEKKHWRNVLPCSFRKYLRLEVDRKKITTQSLRTFN